ncbi:hypothetical protein WR25_07623 [Diploscapter pachys]|uniref:Uncharacterized protein n=1 Tax=Diploscapter pachys TaxID=2018661 RepID=A0A2A2J6V7_9BILA|nr:hypothetical protein WR25_07623 [Diploscapter pachys]
MGIMFMYIAGLLSQHSSPVPVRLNMLRQDSPIYKVRLHTIMTQQQSPIEPIPAWYQIPKSAQAAPSYYERREPPPYERMIQHSNAYSNYAPSSYGSRPYEPIPSSAAVIPARRYPPGQDVSNRDRNDHHQGEHPLDSTQPTAPPKLAPRQSIAQRLHPLFLRFSPNAPYDSVNQHQQTSAYAPVHSSAHSHRLVLPRPTPISVLLSSPPSALYRPGRVEFRPDVWQPRGRGRSSLSARTPLILEKLLKPFDKTKNKLIGFVKHLKALYSINDLFSWSKTKASMQ